MKFADASPKLPQNSSPKLIEDHTAFLPATIHSLPRSSLYLSVIFIVLCPHCHGQGLIREVKDVVKHPGVKGIPPFIKPEVVESTCRHCAGKGWISTACRDCHGRGLVLDKKRTELHKVPVQNLCGRCNGKGYSRLPTTLVKGRVIRLVPDMTNYQWHSGYAEVINILVTKCWQEESYAEAELKRITS
ncbi:TPA: hypothetical protein MFD58_002835 [Klebsiella pneumoniae]|nr:hypothetical protein [Klebsiella pneumoniae]